MLHELLIDLVVVFCVVMIGITVGGYLLPEQHIAKTGATINRHPEVFFELITDFPKWPGWNKDAQKVERLPDQNGHMVWRLGNLLVEIVDMLEPINGGPGRLTTRIADPKSPFGGTWTWLIEPIGGGSQVTIIEEGTIKNPLFRFLAKYLFGHHATAKTYLYALATHFGQPVKVEEIR